MSGTARPCLHCGDPTWASSRIHPKCANQAFVAKFEDLISARLGWGQITASFGIKPDSIEKALERAERPDLMRVWREQFRDGGGYTTPGWVASQRIHSANRARPKRLQKAGV